MQQNCININTSSFLSLCYASQHSLLSFFSIFPVSSRLSFIKHVQKENKKKERRKKKKKEETHRQSPLMAAAAAAAAASSVVDLRHGQKALTLTVLALERAGASRLTKQQEAVHQWLVADETGAVRRRRGEEEGGQE